MLDFLNTHPQLSSAKELLAGVLYSIEQYKEAKKYFEETEESALIFLGNDRYWMMAWTYHSCREFEKAEHYYRLVLETGADYEYLKNNMGYCLYRQKKYDEAEELFLDCIRNNQGTSYAANNYVRLLVKCNHADEAREFVDNGGYKVAKDFRDRLERLEEQIRAGKKIGKRKTKGTESGKSERKTEVDQTYKGVPQKMDDFIEVKSNGEVSAKMGVNYRTPYDHQKDAMKNMDIMDKEEAYSLGRNMECLKSWLDGEVYLIVDEAHHATAKTYRRIIDYVKENVAHTKVIGLTATPFRTEESEQGLLADIFSDGVEHGKAVKNASGITYKIDLKELIGRGILSKPIFESYYTEAAFGDGLGIDDWENISRLDVMSFLKRLQNR